MLSLDILLTRVPKPTRNPAREYPVYEIHGNTDAVAEKLEPPVQRL